MLASKASGGPARILKSGICWIYVGRDGRGISCSGGRGVQKTMCGGCTYVTLQMGVYSTVRSREVQKIPGYLGTIRTKSTECSMTVVGKRQKWHWRSSAALRPMGHSARPWGTRNSLAFRSPAGVGRAGILGRYRRTKVSFGGGTARKVLGRRLGLLDAEWPSEASHHSI
jgi:hypothetical protein